MRKIRISDIVRFVSALVIVVTVSVWLGLQIASVIVPSEDHIVEVSK